MPKYFPKKKKKSIHCNKTKTSIAFVLVSLCFPQRNSSVDDLEITLHLLNSKERFYSLRPQCGILFDHIKHHLYVSEVLHRKSLVSFARSIAVWNPLGRCATRAHAKLCIFHACHLTREHFILFRYRSADDMWEEHTWVGENLVWHIALFPLLNIRLALNVNVGWMPF